jgi:hypothetical protein
MAAPNTFQIDPIVQKEYDRARRHAFWRRIRARLGHQCNDLLPAESVLHAAGDLETRRLGLQQVPLHKIVGSSGRFRDYDLGFYPLRREKDGRWLSIARARRQGIKLPPPLLYQIGDAYFVEDGNHRISVARAAGQETIEAHVIAMDTSHLTADPTCTRLGYKIKNEEC